MKTVKLQFSVPLFQKGDMVKDKNNRIATVLKDEIEPATLDDIISCEILIRFWPTSIYMLPDEVEEVLVKKNEIKYVYSQ